MHDSPLWDAFLTGGLSLLLLVLLGRAGNKSTGRQEGFMRLLVDGPEMGLKCS